MAAQDVATMTFDPSEVRPVGATSRHYKLPIRLKASTVFARGQVLSLVPSSVTNTYGPYVRAASDGTQLAECILPRACATDASGNITYGGAATGGEWGQTDSTTSAFFGGVFNVADIPSSGTNGIDAAAVTAMGGKLQQAGKFLSF